MWANWLAAPTSRRGDTHPVCFPAARIDVWSMPAREVPVPREEVDMAGIRKVVAVAAAMVLGSCSGGGAEKAPLTALAGPAPASLAEGLYGIDLSLGLVYVDPATAAATVIGPVGLPVATAGADFDCDGTLWAFSSVGGETMALYTVDLGTGAAALARSFATPGLPTGSGFEFGPDEATPFWRNNSSLYTLDQAAGTVQLVGPSGNGVSLTMPASCDQFLGGDCGGEGCTLARIDPATAAVTPVGPTGGIAFTSLAAAPDGTLYAHSSGSLYRLDPATGAPTLIGPILVDGESAAAPVGMAYGPHGVCCRPLDCGAAEPTAATLWPPNHGLVEVGIQGLADPGGQPVAVAVTGVRQDEPVNDRGDGNTAPDAVLAGGAVKLRAERSGGGDGRVYHVDFTASTAGGRSCQGSVQVCVPHDQGQGAACVDQGPLHDSTAP